MPEVQAGRIPDTELRTTLKTNPEFSNAILFLVIKFAHVTIVVGVYNFFLTKMLIFLDKFAADMKSTKNIA